LGGLLGALIKRLRRPIVLRSVDDGLADIAAATGTGSPN
jgi:hypothetical protein